MSVLFGRNPCTYCLKNFLNGAIFPILNMFQSDKKFPIERFPKLFCLFS